MGKNGGDLEIIWREIQAHEQEFIDSCLCNVTPKPDHVTDVSIGLLGIVVKCDCDHVISKKEVQVSRVMKWHESLNH